MATRFSVLHHAVSTALLVAFVASTFTSVAAADQPAAVDPRVTTYAQRQAIRDRYRGQIDELTFNDEIGDGVPLDQALADALNAHTVQIAGHAR